MLILYQKTGTYITITYILIKSHLVPVRDVVLDGDAYTGDWESSDCAEDGDVVDADVGDEAPELV